jgi:hypothetical protein
MVLLLSSCEQREHERVLVGRPGDGTARFSNSDFLVWCRGRVLVADFDHGAFFPQARPHFNM